MMALKENETAWLGGPGPPSDTLQHREVRGIRREGVTQSQSDVTHNLSGNSTHEDRADTQMFQQLTRHLSPSDICLHRALRLTTGFEKWTT